MREGLRLKKQVTPVNEHVSRMLTREQQERRDGWERIRA